MQIIHRKNKTCKYLGKGSTDRGYHQFSRKINFYNTKEEELLSITLFDTNSENNNGTVKLASVDTEGKYFYYFYTGTVPNTDFNTCLEENKDNQYDCAPRIPSPLKLKIYDIENISDQIEAYSGATKANFTIEIPDLQVNGDVAVLWDAYDYTKETQQESSTSEEQ
jgi:hypothetical protein